MSEVALESAKSRTRESLALIADEIVALSRDLHAHPELGLEETRSSRVIVDAVERLTGVHSVLGLGSLPTAFRAETGTGELVVTLCAEYDALPGIGHACGHNVITAAAVGAFTLLAPLADELGITVRLLGTPGEENAGGKSTMLKEGSFEGTHAALMVHPGPLDALGMDSLASGGIDIEFTGQQAHASAAPHEGINALDAMTIMLTAIGLARQQLEPYQQIHGYVRHAGSAPNVIPGAAGGTWMARADTAESLNRVMGVIRRCAEAGAHATGAKVAFSEGDFRYLDLRPDAALNAAYGENLAAMGRTTITMPKGGSTDMGNVSHEFPSIHPMIGFDAPTTLPHTVEFAALAGAEPGDRASLDGAVLLASTVIDAALNPELRTRLLAKNTLHTSVNA